jgi:hypothetical protein
MKQPFLKLFLLCVINLTINAQSIDRNVIATTGGSALVNGQYIEWTIGESVIETINNKDLIISQGFHQPIGTMPLYRINGNILGDGLPFSDAEVFLYIADADTLLPPLSKSNAPDGSFSFTFIPEDHYLLFAVPDVSDEYYPTYYVQTIDRNKAYVLEADANIGGLDLRLVSKDSLKYKSEQEKGPDFTIFPNPFIDHLTILINNDYQRTYKIKIDDLTGKMVLFKEISSNEITTLNLTNFPDGLYVVHIENELGTTNRLVSKVKLTLTGRE